MGEEKYKYTAKFKQPQKVAGIQLLPAGGSLSERNYKDLKKDAYGKSLIDEGLLIVTEITDKATPKAEVIPDLKEGKGK